MKILDAKSFAAGLVTGTLGITTVFAATGIQSAVLSGTAMTLNGTPLPLDRSLVSVTMEQEPEAVLYAPAEELLAKLGYTLRYDKEGHTLEVLSDGSLPRETASAALPEGNVAINVASHAGQKNLAESGSFQAEDHQTLVLKVTSDIRGGSVDLFLFDPSGKEQRMTIESGDMTREIPLEKGTWQYNCSGLFKDGGSIRITGTIR